MANGINPYLDEQLSGLSTYADYTDSATSHDTDDYIDALLAIVEPSKTQNQRGLLDMMSMPAQLQMIAELRALKTALKADTGLNP